MALSFSVFNKFKAIDGVTKPVKGMTRATDKFGTRTQAAFKKADKSAGRFSKKLKKIAAIAATIVGVAAITAQLTDAVVVGAQFEQTIVNASAKFGDSARRGTKNFKALEDAARKAGETTEFASTEAAAGLDFLAMAGFNVEQSITSLPLVIDLATAANLDLARATDIASDTLGAFNLQTKDAAKLQANLARVSDVMAKTVTSANTNMEQLFETFVEAGPAATNLGASIETVAALSGKLADAGIKGSTAGTTLKNVFLSLSAATPKAIKQFEKLGLKIDDGEGGFRDIVDILGDLNGALSSLGEVERAAVLKDIFGKIPISGVNVLLSTGADKIRAFRTELEAATGASAQMAATMRATTQNQLKIFASTVESLKITAFFAFRDVISGVTAKLTDLVRISAVWVKQNQALIDTSLVLLTDVMEGIVNVFGTAIAIVTSANDLFGGLLIPTILGLVAAFKAWAAIQVIVNAVLLANPVGILIVAVIAAAAGIKALIDNWDLLVSTFKSGGEVRTFLTDFVLEPLKKILALIVRLSPQVRGLVFIAKKVRSFFGTEGEEGEKPARAPSPIDGPLSANAGLSKTIREETRKSTVDVNFNNLPDGTEVEQREEVPGFNLQTGFSGAAS